MGDNLKKKKITYVSPEQISFCDISQKYNNHPGTGFKEWLEDYAFEKSSPNRSSSTYFHFNGESFSQIEIRTIDFKSRPTQNIFKVQENYLEEVTITFQPNDKEPKDLLKKLEELEFKKI